VALIQTQPLVTHTATLTANRQRPEIPKVLVPAQVPGTENGPQTRMNAGFLGAVLEFRGFPLFPSGWGMDLK
jgi:hypothetical protein